MHTTEQAFQDQKTDRADFLAAVSHVFVAAMDVWRERVIKSASASIRAKAPGMILGAAITLTFLISLIIAVYQLLFLALTFALTSLFPAASNVIREIGASGILAFVSLLALVTLASAGRRSLHPPANATIH